METIKNLPVSFRIFVVALVCAVFILGFALYLIKKGQKITLWDAALPQQFINEQMVTFPREALIDPNATELPPGIMPAKDGWALVRVFSSKQSPDQLLKKAAENMIAMGWKEESLASSRGSSKLVSYVKNYSRVSFSFPAKAVVAGVLVITYYPRLAIYDIAR